MDYEAKPLGKRVGMLIRNSANKAILDLNAGELEKQFKAAGVLLFRGFELSAELFGEFTARFASTFLIHRNPMRLHVTSDGTTQTVQSNQEGIPLHGEMHYLPRISTQLGPPDIVWFYCVRPGRTAGETLLCDGVQVFEALSGATKNLLMEKRLRYSHTTPAAEWRRLAAGRSQLLAMLSAIDGVANGRFDEADNLLWDYHVHAARPTRYSRQVAFINSILTPAYYRIAFEDGSAIPAEVMDEIVRVTDRLTFPLCWQANDLAMIDNSRLMHGRRLNDDQRLIYVRMSLARF